MPGSLEFVKSNSTTSNVSSLSVDDCFTTEYDIYKCVLEIDEVGTEIAIETRLQNSSGPVTSSNYDHAYRFMRVGSGSYSSQGNQGNDKWQFTMYNEGAVGGFYVMYVYNPANSSKYTFAHWQMASHYYASSTAVLMTRRGIGVLEVEEAHTGIQIYGLSSNITNAKLSVYGVAK